MTNSSSHFPFNRSSGHKKDAPVVGDLPGAVDDEDRHIFNRPQRALLHQNTTQRPKGRARKAFRI